jgi:basic membrane lipoprotein Med (substrate-binding protein (PBP1-ABC) superfamily)
VPAKVAYVTVVGSTSDGSLGESTYRGFATAVKTPLLGARVFFVAPQATWASELGLVAREGYDLVVAAPGPFIDLRAVRDAALRFPRSTFLTEDVDRSLVPHIPRNMAVYTLRTNEAAYLAGYLSALALGAVSSG